MKKIISAREIQEIIRSGGDVRSLPQDASYTAAAREFLRELADTPSEARALATPVNCAVFSGKVPTLKSSVEEINAWFNSPEMQAHKAVICDIGRRMWERSYCDGNGGNISLRVSKDFVLCTPTMVSKGFLKPEHMCLVDLDGNQKAGFHKRTSEILMHLQMMKAQPRALSVVHCHPVHATAFAVAQIEPPTGMIPEAEIMVGKVPVAGYRTPGTMEMGKLVANLVDQHNTILMGNHGAVAWSHVGIEDAYWKMEVLESYCRTVWIASQLGSPLKRMTGEQIQDLLKIKQTLGIPDPRIGLEVSDLHKNDTFRPGVMLAAPEGKEIDKAAEKEIAALIRTVTEHFLARLKG